MKNLKTILILLCSFSFSTAFAQNDRADDKAHINPSDKIVYEEGYEVPEEVQRDFDRRNPNTEISNLSTTEDGYTIGYKKDGKEYISKYDSQNNWIQTSKRMDFEELPSEAQSNFMGTQYANYSVDRVERVNKGDREFYQLNIENAGTSRNVYMDTNGNLLDNLNNDSPDTDGSPGTPGTDYNNDRGVDQVKETDSYQMDNNINRDNRMGRSPNRDGK